MRTFFWWFGMGALLTLSILMIQGGVYELPSETHSAGSATAVVTLTMTILGGGLLAGCVALILNRLR